MATVFHISQVVNVVLWNPCPSIHSPCSLQGLRFLLAPSPSYSDTALGFIPWLIFFSVGDLEALTIIRLGMNPNCSSNSLSFEHRFRVSSLLTLQTYQVWSRPSPPSALVKYNILNTDPHPPSRPTWGPLAPYAPTQPIWGCLLTSVVRDGFLSSLSALRAQQWHGSCSRQDQLCPQLSHSACEMPVNFTFHSSSL